MRRTCSILLFASLALVACQAQEAAMQTDETAAAPATMADVEQVQAQWIQAAEAGDAAAVASLYAPDAIMMVAGEPPMMGRQAIQAGFSFEGLTDMAINTERTELGIELVSTWGTYAQTYQTPDGAGLTVTGRFLAVARRQEDGSWQIVNHVSIPDAMPEETGAAEDM